MEKKVFLLGLLPFIFFNGINLEETIIIGDYPYNYDNVFVLTIDDLTLNEKHDFITVEKILKFLEEKEIPATFFAIPKFMKGYNFPEGIEVAQHGYDHKNPFDNSPNEFSNLNDKEIKLRLEKGKKLLEERGFKIKGFRAPGFSLDKIYLDKLKELYEYDSSFQETIEGEDDFIIYPIWLDLLESDFCSRNRCNLTKINQREKEIKKQIKTKDNNKEAIIILTHFWKMEKAFDHVETENYLNKFFDEIDNHNYWKTTMYDYHKWKEDLNKIEYKIFPEEDKIKIEFSERLEGLTFEVHSLKEINSNYQLKCQTIKSKQVCIID